MTELTLWKIEECAAYFDRLRLRGWCHVAGGKIERVELVVIGTDVVRPIRTFGLPSPDVDQAYGPGAAHVRFEEWIPLPGEFLGKPFSLRCWLTDGRCVIGRDGLTNAAVGDPYYQSWENFITALSRIPAGHVLEIGSRARSAITRRHRIPSHLSYVGVDILPGPNVDVLADAHYLTRFFPEQRFAAIFSTSVFEHLAMPWKVVLEMNRVLVPGGLVYTATHQTWPLHEEPWDFWRFSRYSWKTIFNEATGFEIVEAVMGEPARVHPNRTESMTRDMPASHAYLGSAALVRKIAETELRWPVPVTVATDSMYPLGELSEAPTANAS
jgi:hypothetical protein